MEVFKKVLAVCMLPFSCFSSFAQSNVTVAENKTSNQLEIRNGLLGVVVPNSTSIQTGQGYPAPLQSFIYADGSYSDNTPNLLTVATNPVSLKTTLITNNGSQVVVEMLYRFQKKEFEIHGKRWQGGGAGPGFYRCTITVNKGGKSIVIEDDTDYDITYSVKISRGISPDQARYRGWSAETADQGYERKGVAYRSQDQRGYPMDATVDLDYSKPWFRFPYLTLWEPAGGEVNTGRYWQVFNSGAGANSNLIGFFQGKPSRLLGAIAIGPRLVTYQQDRNGEKNDAEILVNIERLAPDQSWVARKRFQWGVFISQKKDLLAPEMNQPIGKELNMVAGLGGVIKTYASKPAKLVPSFYQGAVYMNGESMSALCKKLKTDGALYNQLVYIDGTYKALWDAWRFPDSARSLLKSLTTLADAMPEIYTSKEGTYTTDFRYWKGARMFKYYALCAAGLFADKAISISVQDRQKLEQLIALMARIIWDDNNVPFFLGSAVNSGPANMSFQYENTGRLFFALLLSTDPEFRQRANDAAAAIKYSIQHAVYANGSSFGTPHYTQATIDPILFSMLQLKQAGGPDLFMDKDIRNFAGFYCSLVTPPSCRFMNNRKLISFGDGSEENAATFGLLATGLANVDPALSRRLRNVFFYGSPVSSFAGPVPLAVDLSSTADRSFESGSCNYAGYMSAFRTGVNSSYESALWMLNGDSLYDHRNDDAGETVIYAMGAPLSLSRSSFYYPSATDARIRSVVVPEKLFPNWSGADQPIDGRSLTNRTWPSSTNTDFVSLGYSVVSRALMKTKEGSEWWRQVAMIATPDNNPIFIYYDSLKGTEPAIWSMPMMSEGPVATALGNIEAPQRIYNNENLKQLPAGTAVRTLAPGINRFAFSGQPWKAHASGGINWYLYTSSAGNMDFSLANFTTTWENSYELQEFASTNQANYSESQTFLRLKSNRPFFNMILPFAKGKNVYAGVEAAGQNGFRIHMGSQEYGVFKGGYFFKSDKRFVMASFGQTIMQYNGYSIEGGSAELENTNGKLLIRIHGVAGKRIITVPFNASETKDAIVKTAATGSTISISYDGSSMNLPNGEKGYKEYIFAAK